MSVTGDDLVTEAKKFLGDPYVYGASGPSTFDCSGLIWYVAKQLGISVPRTSEEQAHTGTPVSKNDLAPGDLVFSPGYDGTIDKPGHVGMYIGSGQLIESPHTGADVRVSSLQSFGATSYRRITGVAAGTGTGGAQAADWWNSSTWGGVFQWPQDIVNFFTAGVDDLTAAANFFSAFFKPSTYVRIGAGFFGTLFLVAGFVFLIRESRN